MTHELWSSLNVKILEYLSGVTIADLVAMQKNDNKVILMSRKESTEKTATAG